MEKYQLRFFFEHAGPCFWGANDKTTERYGYAIEANALSLSDNLFDELNDLDKEYATIINWDSPADPSPWTKEQKTDFIARANIVYERIKNELGDDYEVINKVAQVI